MKTKDKITVWTWRSKKGKVLARVDPKDQDAMDNMNWNPPDEDFDVFRETYVLVSSRRMTSGD